MIMPIITISGNAYQRGISYGQQARDLIVKGIDNYTRLFMDRKGLARKQAQAIAKGFLPYINEEHQEEMRGLATGAGVDFNDILMLNCRSELLFTDITANACTAFAVLPQATRDHKIYAGQTWDFAKIQRDIMIIVRVIKEDGSRIIMFNEAGMIGGKGLNSHGIGLTLNALNTKGLPAGLPLHIRMRDILDADTLAAAYQKAVARPIACSATLIISHRDGLALGVETTCEGVDVIMPEAGILTHTNHILSSRLTITDNNRFSGSTFVRLAAIKEIMSGHRNIDVPFLKQMLMDHRGYPNSICVHSDPQRPDIKQIATNQALIMDLAQGVIHYVGGNPCQETFLTVALKDEGSV